MSVSFNFFIVNYLLHVRPLSALSARTFPEVAPDLTSQAVPASGATQKKAPSI